MCIKYLIVGLGQTGLSCARFLSETNQQFAVADSRENPPGLSDFQKKYPSVPMYLGPFSDDIFLKAKTLVVSPGVSLDTPAIAKALSNNAKLISDIDLFANAAKAPTIAVTGSNGKSTTVTLLGEVIKSAGKKAIVCGNIGLPVLDALQQDVPDYYVVELSSFQLAMSMQLKPKVAVLLNISPDHLDRHASFNDYLAAKKKVYHHAKYSVINADEPQTYSDVTFTHSPITFSLSTHKIYDWHLLENNGEIYLAHGNEAIISVNRLGLKGRANWQNCLAVLAIAGLLQLPLDKTIVALTQFSGLPHRCQLLQTNDCVHWINDSKATNVGAAIAAIDSIASLSDGRCVLIAGGDSKGVSLEALRQVVKDNIFHVVVMGQDAPKLEETLVGCAEITRVENMQSAVIAAAKFANPGDTVLLSPACASLDQYANYMERGNDFIAAVEALCHKT